ncbi:hypothetical protein SEPCBS57363_004353 [Sporothrix epigloea]|uniref:Ef hand domain containing protein n=1 Tax=Sporothrix epigloea TaxID=1892477 RepID=A0ABP0DRK8_9PEZI
MEERQVYGQLFRQADPENTGIVIGEVAVKFFEKTRLDSRILGEIWQIADKENRGFLTPAGFGVALRLIGHAQMGKEPSPSTALQKGPLPRFEGIVTAAGTLPSQSSLTANVTGPLSAQGTGTSASQMAPQGTGGSTLARVPPLTPDRAAQYARIFQDQTKGEPTMSGDSARRIFEKSGLGIHILGRIWQLADTEQRGSLVQTEFIIAMHLLTSTKSGALRALPAMLPAALYEAATRGVAAASSGSDTSIGAAFGSPASPVNRQQSPHGGGLGAMGILPPPPSTSISRQMTGMRPAPPNFSAGPLGRPAPPTPTPMSSGSEWLITPAEKARMDPVFLNLDKDHKGYITGEEAVPFLTRSGLNEDQLAQVWDLADVNSEGYLTSDTFAVALYLIQQQRQRADGSSALPSKLPANLIPPSLRSKVPAASPPPVVAPTPPPPQLKSAMDDLFGLDSGASFAPSLPALAATPTGVSAVPGGLSDPFATSSSPIQPSSPTRSPAIATTSFRPFVPSSSFGRSLKAQATGDSNSSSLSAAARSAPPSAHQPATTTQPVASPTSAQNDLLGGDDGEVSRSLSNDTAELANLSNQIGSLSKHMQETTTHRSALQAELSQTSTQKKNFEQRLAQLRTLYEKEARDVRALEDQLKTSRNDTKTLQTQLATLEASYQEMQTQQQTVFSSLQADQRENAKLKERMQTITAEVNQLKSQVEKLKSEARQQKGIVAINRKQLAHIEGEREKLKTEAEDLTRQNQDLARQIHNASVSSATSSVASPSVASASGKNPFFRRTASTDIMAVLPSPPQSQPHSLASVATAQPFGEKSFDDVFGPGPTSASPALSASAIVPAPVPAVAALKPEITGASTGSSSFSAVTAPTSDTATPSISRQATDLATATHASFSPPTTSMASPSPARETPDVANLPTAAVTSAAESASVAPSPSPVAAADAPAVATPESYAAQQLVSDSFATAAPAAAAVESGTSDTATPAAEADKAKSVWDRGHAQNDSLSDPFTSPDQKQDKTREDFESAFASFKAARAAEPSGSAGGDADVFDVKTPATTAPAVPAKEDDAINTDTAKAFASFNTEFPPISELYNDDFDSDSDGGGGFDDDFAPASPKNESSQKTPEASSLAAAAEPIVASQEASDASHRESDALSKATSPVVQSSAPGLPDIFSSSAADAPSAPSPKTNIDDIFHAPAASVPAAPTSEDSAFDELDDDFEGLEDAREGSADDEFAAVNGSNLDDFQSAFDSSPTGKPDSHTSLGVDSSYDFSTLGAPAASAAISQNADSSKAPEGSTDWFSFTTDAVKPAATESAPVTGDASASTAERAARPPAPNRMDTQESTTNDDPILQKLTSMGYARSVALDALEKYNYNVDRAANFLANES